MIGFKQIQLAYFQIQENQASYIYIYIYFLNKYNKLFLFHEQMYNELGKINNLEDVHLHTLSENFNNNKYTQQKLLKFLDLISLQALVIVKKKVIEYNYHNNYLFK